MSADTTIEKPSAGTTASDRRDPLTPRYCSPALFKRLSVDLAYFCLMIRDGTFISVTPKNVGEAQPPTPELWFPCCRSEKIKQFLDRKARRKFPRTPRSASGQV